MKVKILVTLFFVGFLGNFVNCEKVSYLKYLWSYNFYKILIFDIPEIRFLFHENG